MSRTDGLRDQSGSRPFGFIIGDLIQFVLECSGFRASAWPVRLSSRYQRNRQRLADGAVWLDSGARPLKSQPSKRSLS